MPIIDPIKTSKATEKYIWIQYQKCMIFQKIYNYKQQFQKIVKMGNGVSKNQPLPFNLNEYEQIPNKNEDEIPVNYKIFRNIHSGVQMQQYRLQFNDQVECRQYYQAFKWRLNQEHIVNTIYFVENNKNQFCSTAYAGFLYTQRIPIKLSDIKDIPFPDNLYILLICFEGFSTIYKKTQYFQIQQNLICINNDARVKVWINSDLSKNYPEDIEAEDQKDERDMVQKIIQLIESNTDQHSQPKSLTEYFAQYQLPTFAQARLLLKQYAKQYKATIPNKFESITEYLHGEQVQLSQDNMQIIDSRKYEQNGNTKYTEKNSPQNIMYRQKSNEFYHKNQKPEQNHSYIQPHNQYNDNQNLQYRYQNQIHQPANNIVISSPPYRNYSNFSSNVQPMQTQIIRPQNQVVFNYRHPNQFNPIQQPYTIIRPPLQQYQTINPHQHQFYPQSQQYYHMPVVMQNRQFVQINSPKVQGAPMIGHTYYNNPNIKQVRSVNPIVNSGKRVNMTNVPRQMQSNNIVDNIEEKLQEQSAVSNHQLHKDKSKFKLTETQDEKISNKNNSVTNFQNKYSNNRDLDIFNEEFNKYREINQFNNVRSNKEQIVRSAKEILQVRERQARKIHQQKLEMQQQQQQRVDMQSAKPYLYHSIQQYHELDPQIAQDLLNMNI